MALSFQNFSEQLKNNSAIYSLEYMKVIYLQCNMLSQKSQRKKFQNGLDPTHSKQTTHHFVDINNLYSQPSQNIYRWIQNKNKACFIYKNVYYFRRACIAKAKFKIHSSCHKAGNERISHARNNNQRNYRFLSSSLSFCIWGYPGVLSFC